MDLCGCCYDCGFMWIIKNDCGFAIYNKLFGLFLRILYLKKNNLMMICFFTIYMYILNLIQIYYYYILNLVMYNSIIQSL